MKAVVVGSRLRIPMAEVQRIAAQGEPVEVRLPAKRARAPLPRRDATPAFDLTAEREKLRAWDIVRAAAGRAERRLQQPPKTV